MKSDRTQRGPTGFILLEPGNIMQILPEDNKSWLPIFFQFLNIYCFMTPRHSGRLFRGVFSLVRREVRLCSF